MNLWTKIKCATGHHSLQWIKPIDEQWVLWECEHCGKEYEHRYRLGTLRAVKKNK